MKVLVICFANTCRSPVAEALFHNRLGENDGVTVLSRGLAGGDGVTPEPLLRALAAVGLAVSATSGATLERDEAREADLLLFMERQLLRDAVVGDPQLWRKSFTLREFARRGFLNPPDISNESFVQWLAVLHASRSRDEMLGTNPSDDIADPGLAGSEGAFAAMIEQLRLEVDRVAPMLSGWPSNSP